LFAGSNPAPRISDNFLFFLLPLLQCLLDPLMQPTALPEAGSMNQLWLRRLPGNVAAAYLINRVKSNVHHQWVDPATPHAPGAVHQIGGIQREGIDIT